MRTFAPIGKDAGLNSVSVSGILVNGRNVIFLLICNWSLGGKSITQCEMGFKGRV